MEHTIASKLSALLELQAIDTQLDEITKLRGALPEEVEELREVVEHLQQQKKQAAELLTELEEGIGARKQKIKDLERLVKKYEEQQMEVRNNREYDAITKEIDLQKLDIQLLEKHIKTAYEEIDRAKIEQEEGQANIIKKEQLLQDKQKELEASVEDSAAEEGALTQSRDRAMRQLDQALQKAYERIRGSVRNKLAVVAINKEACGGCFNQIPPQKQIDIKEKKRITLCEHCGRIIADVVEVVAEE